MLGKPDVSVELIHARSLIQASSLNHIFYILSKPDWTQSKVLDVVSRYGLADKVHVTSGFPYIGMVCNATKPNEARSHEKYRLINEQKVLE